MVIESTKPNYNRFNRIFNFVSRNRFSWHTERLKTLVQIATKNRKPIVP
jgi:hypothetical protein